MRAVHELARLPGIGEKTAEKLIFHLLHQPEARVQELASALGDLRGRTVECSRCHNLAEIELCDICTDPRRDPTQLLVVEMPQDLHRFERHCDWRGLYHVLGGRYSPLEGIYPEDLNIDHLERRVRQEGISEVVLATSPNAEGEATTALLRSRLEHHKNLKLTRLATGLPQGAELAWVSRSVLQDALHFRRKLNEQDSRRGGLS